MPGGWAAELGQLELGQLELEPEWEQTGALRAPLGIGQAPKKPSQLPALLERLPPQQFGFLASPLRLR